MALHREAQATIARTGSGGSVDRKDTSQLYGSVRGVEDVARNAEWAISALVFNEGL